MPVAPVATKIEWEISNLRETESATYKSEPFTVNFGDNQLQW
jgi:hypothetical protein